MTTECRRLTDYDSVFTGIDVTARRSFEDELVAFPLGKRLTEATADYTGPESGWLAYSTFTKDIDGEMTT